MNQLNSLILEGKFAHFTSKKGTLPLEFLIENNGKKYTVAVPNEKMAGIFISKKPSSVRVVGRLDRNGKSVYITAEHIEMRK